MSSNMENFIKITNEREKQQQTENPIEKIRESVVEEAYATLNRKPRPRYVWGGNGPNNYDCSGFSTKMYDLAGLKIPRKAQWQSDLSGEKLSKNELKPGDLVFYGKGDKNITHVAVYVGDGKVIESGGGGRNNGSSNPGEGIRLKNVDYRKDFRGGLSLERVAAKVGVKGNNIKKSKEELENTIGTKKEKSALEKEKNNVPNLNDERRFEKIYDYLLGVEGGYSNDKNDRGGETTWGITEREARRHGYKGDMRDFSKNMAKDIYKKDYYYKNRLNEVKNDALALSVCDWIVNSGSIGVKRAQKVLNQLDSSYNLVVDGIIGKNTLNALNSVDPNKFLKAYHSTQRNFYNGLATKDPSQKKFLKGWLNRVSRKENYIQNKLVENNMENGRKQLEPDKKNQQIR